VRTRAPLMLIVTYDNTSASEPVRPSLGTIRVHVGEERNPRGGLRLARRWQSAAKYGRRAPAPRGDGTNGLRWRTAITIELVFGYHVVRP
jgi:hypothetical protein